MESLDVKFVVHQGEFIRQKMSGREELAGREVILVYRLLKNEVGKTFGARAYALYSDACVQAMGIDPRAQGLVEHAEAIEHIGETKCWVSDLEQAWTRESESAHTVVQRADAIGVLDTTSRSLRISAETRVDVRYCARRVSCESRRQTLDRTGSTRTGDTRRRGLVGMQFNAICELCERDHRQSAALYLPRVRERGSTRHWCSTSAQVVDIGSDDQPANTGRGCK
jgi:hypothetical protein